MKSLRTLLVSALLATSCIAPAYAGKVDDPSLYTTEALKKNLILGKTTKEQVRAIYGEPNVVDRASAKDGGYERGWTYYPTESHVEKIRESLGGVFRSMVPGGRGTSTAVEEAQDHGVGARNTKEYSVSIQFDANGVVTDYSQGERNRSKKAF